jgi:hypothetical protein
MIRPALLLGALTLLGCHGHDDAEANLILVDTASDEAFAELKVQVAAGKATSDTFKAPTLLAPADGAQVPRSEKPTIRWGFPVEKVPHGVETGRFAWIELSGSSLEGGFHIFALGSTSYIPDEEAWATIAGSGTVTVKTYAATMEDGKITAGPYAGATTTFKVLPQER